MSASGANTASAASASTASSTLHEVPLPETADRVHAQLVTLFKCHEERAKLLKRSRELNEQMKKIKKSTERWMLERNLEHFKVSTCGRKMKRVKRNVYAKMTIPDIVDWVKDRIGDEWAVELQKEIEMRNKKVIATKDEYRITYLGVRKRNVQVAPDDGRKRPSAQ